MSRKFLWILGTVSLLAASGRALSGTGQDPVPLYPDNYKILFENERVRVLDFRLAKGAKENAHTHPAHVVYVLTGFKVRFTLGNGETLLRETKDSQVLFRQPVTHASENLGTTDAHGILVELK